MSISAKFHACIIKCTIQTKNHLNLLHYQDLPAAVWVSHNILGQGRFSRWSRCGAGDGAYHAKLAGQDVWARHIGSVTHMVMW